MTATETVQVFTTVSADYGPLFVSAFTIITGLGIVAFFIRVFVGAARGIQ